MIRVGLAVFVVMTMLACGSDSGDVDDGGGTPPDASSTGDANPVIIDPGAGDYQLDLVGTFTLAMAADLAGSRELQVVAISEWMASAVTLIDVSDPQTPAFLARIDGVGTNADVQIHGNYLYVNSENWGGTGNLTGVRIYDISDPAEPRLATRVGPLTGHEGLQSCHNVWVQPDRQLFYCASTHSGDVIILSTGDGGVGNIDVPAFVAAIESPGQACRIPHDMYALGNRLYVAWICDGLAIYDIADPFSPELIGAHNYPDSRTHNLWPTDDGNYLVSSDEVIGGHMRIWDIRDLDNIAEVGAYQPAPGAAIHNVEVVDDIAFISHYTAGVHVVDISDRAAPRAIDFDDFISGPDVIGEPISAFRGAWGVEPMLPYVHVSNMEGGLRTYHLTPVSGE